MTERIVAALHNLCRHCNGTGWLRFSCGTPWRCLCNPPPRFYFIAGQEPKSTGGERDLYSEDL